MKLLDVYKWRIMEKGNYAGDNKFIVQVGIKYVPIWIDHEGEANMSRGELLTLANAKVRLAKYRKDIDVKESKEFFNKKVHKCE